MLKHLRRLFRPEGETEVASTASSGAAFSLQYEGLVVGILRTVDGGWEFAYSPEFREQVNSPQGIQPLVEFPDPKKIYTTDDLWPFFMARIPSVAQPQVRERIQELKIDERDAVQLLRTFGERSITNPFLLTPA